LWLDAELRTRLARAGRESLARYTPDDFRERLGAILDDAKARAAAGVVPA
jgi:hypothetical protein